LWTEHLTAVEDLREGINLRAFGQLDPLIEYKNEAFKMFERLMAAIDYESIRRILTIEIQTAESRKKEEQEESKQLVLKSASAIDPFHQQQQKEQAVQAPPRVPQQARQPQQAVDLRPQAPAHPKLGRNDPCHCGSGKKYKRCHYPN
jgi:preprotein translocase subunit SecA